MSSSNFTTGSVVKYALLPRILPRAGDLFLSGFAQLAFLMAQVYRGVRLLPEGHPFLLPANLGRFNMRQVIAAAAANLQFRRENIDQIIVFIALLAGIVLLVTQGFILLSALFIPVAEAGMLLSFGTYFGTPTYGGVGPSQDLAFILLDRVFGVPGIFNSCVDTSAGVTPCMGTLPNLDFDPNNTIYTPPNFPWPYHLGLHAMLQFYSVGLLVVATFIILYFVIVIIAETAQTGTPFGQRFNSVWAPLRLVIALGLLIPITNGLNSAQYITLYMAKFGSNFATNGWFQFNRGMTTAWGTAQAQELIAKPQTPEVDGLLQFMMLAHACKALEEGFITQPTPPATPAGGTTTNGCAGIDTRDDGDAVTAADNEVYIDAYLVKFDFLGSNDAARLAMTDWEQARTFFESGDMTIRIGDRACSNKSQMGRVAPTCGEIVIPAVNPAIAPSEVGSTLLQATYYETVRHLWGEYGPSQGLVNHWRSKEFCDPVTYGPRFFSQNYVGDLELRSKAISFVQTKHCKTTQANAQGIRSWTTPQQTFTTNPGDFEAGPGEDWGTDAAMHYKEGAGASTTLFPGDVGVNPAYTGAIAVANFNTTLNVAGRSYQMDMIAENAIRHAVLAQIDRIAAGDFNIPDDQLARGWAGAGMWYNHIARMNGSLAGATWNYPTPSRYPITMERVLAEVRQNNQNVSAQAQFTPHLGGTSQMRLPRPNEVEAAEVLDGIYRYWGTNKSVQKPSTANPILDFINALFGTKGLFSLDDPQNARANPLALLSSLGKSLVEASIRNIGGATLAMAGNIISGVAKIPVAEQGFQAVSTFLFSIATATLTAGIVLYYVLPFLPFIYFFFAVGNWMKGVFEAMVGVPLWALAHIRIDGNGLPGEAAMNGYYMLFEIFLRPILILFGLLASVTIFQAMATVLNGIWPIATKNLAGANYDLQAQDGWVQSVRGPVDQLFFTVMYAVILYIMALSSFKLIDLIPNQIMRWLGTGVSTFSDLTGDAAQSLTQYSTIVGQQMTSQAIGGMRSMGEGAKGIGQGIANMGKNP